MTALAAERNTPKRDAKRFNHPVKAGAVIFKGGLVMLDASGWAVPASTATTLKPAGIALWTVDNTDGGNGDLNVDVDAGCFCLGSNNDIDRGDIGATAYAVDDATVSSVSTGKSACGVIRDVEGSGATAKVWVEILPPGLTGPVGPTGPTGPAGP